MASKRPSTPDPEPPAELVSSRADAEEKISGRIELGKQLLARTFRSWEDLKAAQVEFVTWSEFNAELLRRLFTSQAFFLEYNRALGGRVLMRSPPLEVETQYFQKEVSVKIQRLESIKGRLVLIPQPAHLEEASVDVQAHEVVGQTRPRKSFVVHGHDEASREAVARFLEKQGIETIILHEVANRGATIIEKFERNSDVDFAVVLLTPDDVGAPASSPDELKPRARQNVILELGYFIAKLGRSNVCALLKGDVDIPTDILGVVYVRMDAMNGWHLSLGRELRSAGFDIDMNRL
jgi:predicted nucleotide-binding protein